MRVHVNFSSQFFSSHRLSCFLAVERETFRENFCTVNLILFENVEIDFVYIGNESGHSINQSVDSDPWSRCGNSVSGCVYHFKELFLTKICFPNPAQSMLLTANN